MNLRAFRKHICLSIALWVFAFGVRSANAATPPVAASYEVIESTDLGSQTKVLVRFHFTNRGQSPLWLQEVVLSDFGHPSTGGPLAQSITLPPGTPEQISQEFVIPRLQFDQWQRGVSPRAVLELKTASGVGITQAIRLVSVPAGNGR